MFLYGNNNHYQSGVKHTPPYKCSY